MTALVVDHSPTARRIVSNVLAQSGHEREEAPDGSAALELLETIPVDVLITGWHLSDMSGIELTQKIRSHPRHGKLPVVMVTTRCLRNHVTAALKAGVNSYIAKPFEPEVLEEKIDRVLQKV